MESVSTQARSALHASGVLACAIARKPIAFVVMERVSIGRLHTHSSRTLSLVLESPGRTTTFTRAASSRSRLVWILLRGAIF